MKTYLVFLRGVNVSGKNIIKMAVLKEVLLQNDFAYVSTYVQSGNVVVRSQQSKEDVRNRMHRLIQDELQLTVPVFVFTVDEVMHILEQAPFPADAEPNKAFVTFLDPIPQSELIEKLADFAFETEQYQLTEKVLYFYVPNGMGKSKMNNNFFENKLKVTATGRNLNTIKKMLELAQKALTEINM